MPGPGSSTGRLSSAAADVAIAAALHVSETTVKTHVAHLLGKPRLRDRVQPVIRAYETWIVRPSS
jgi:DNA-binding NarL/FixJ family response regulator